MNRNSENFEPKDVSIGDSLSMEVGADTKLSVEFVPFDTTNTDCTWSIESGDDCVALSQNGELTAVSLGNAVIKATSKENPSLSAICRVADKEKKQLRLSWYTVKIFQIIWVMSGQSLVLEMQMLF